MKNAISHLFINLKTKLFVILCFQLICTLTLQINAFASGESVLELDPAAMSDAIIYEGQLAASNTDDPKLILRAVADAAVSLSSNVGEIKPTFNDSDLRKIRIKRMLGALHPNGRNSTENNRQVLAYKLVNDAKRVFEDNRRTNLSLPTMIAQLKEQNRIIPNDNSIAKLFLATALRYNATSEESTIDDQRKFVAHSTRNYVDRISDEKIRSTVSTAVNGLFNTTDNQAWSKTFGSSNHGPQWSAIEGAFDALSAIFVRLPKRETLNKLSARFARGYRGALETSRRVQAKGHGFKTKVKR